MQLLPYAKKHRPLPMAERCSWLHRCRKTSSAFKRFTHLRRPACGRAATLGPQTRARCVAVLKSECIYRPGSHAHRGGLPHNLPSGDTAAHGRTACKPIPHSGTAEDFSGLTNWPAAWPNRLKRCLRCWIVPSCKSGRYTFVSSAWWELTSVDYALPCQHNANGTVSTQPSIRAEASATKRYRRGDSG
jgi:hypothetical protein